MLDLDPLMITLGMFSSMLVLLAMGAPLTWALLTVGTGAAYFLWGPSGLELMATSAFAAMDNFLLVALPMFIFMGLMLQRSGITDDLFEMIHKLMGGMPGGLGMGTVVICALIAAMAGVSGAATVSLGIIALPSMLQRGYDKRLCTGTIMAGGALGFLIPPSVLMIVYAFLARESVGKLFAAGLLPGLMLAAIYMLYIFVRARLQPQLAPAIAATERVDFFGKVGSLKALILPGILIGTVLGFIIMGVTSPSEASAVGAAGSIVCAAIYRTLNMKMLREALQGTAKLMGMLLWITIAAVFFSKIYIGLGAGSLITELVEDSSLAPYMVIIAMLACYFVLGMFLDDFAIVFITVPLFVPIVQELGFDTVWFAVLFILSMQSAYLTPPFGYNLFYMRSVAPANVTIYDLYWAAIPFVILQVIGLGLVVAFPQIALWLPGLIFG
ncbi:TRAP transporter large permease subunit [Motiliproteus sp. MSK22-1]|uniref:TRAP transporter large permease n=1 Tax=Motiliproteus sp. MSK22-1 TaxID=1897630 RepID=UPI000977C435|nr:TRAP transporter large permease subunit [Motiliproteus sp. MSK22-1]OMH26253.1 TRAP dicarboxylate transporter subunit DctM [Motiliproteus sp. MSK22-1]